MFDTEEYKGVTFTKPSISKLSLIQKNSKNLDEGDLIAILCTYLYICAHTVKQVVKVKDFENTVLEWCDQFDESDLESLGEIVNRFNNNIEEEEFEVVEDKNKDEDGGKS
tara:strand:+ start:540 stop:869 length:330 start_codon:yes stop_codon:yes gene_type:complete